MALWLVSGSSCADSSPGRGDCVVFLGTTLIQGGAEKFLLVSCYRNRVKPLMDHLARMPFIYRTAKWPQLIGDNRVVTLNTLPW